jgi:hypothetical protein
MIFNGDFRDPWAPDEPRSCKLTFIGKNLDKAALAAGFKECLATDENKAKRAKKLRFAVGQQVECNVGSWEPGEVVSLFYRDQGMPPGVTAPYQVKLDDGRMVFAPEDDEKFIREKKFTQYE